MLCPRMRPRRTSSVLLAALAAATAGTFAGCAPPEDRSAVSVESSRHPGAGPGRPARHASQLRDLRAPRKPPRLPTRRVKTPKTC